MLLNEKKRKKRIFLFKCGSIIIKETAHYRIVPSSLECELFHEKFCYPKKWIRDVFLKSKTFLFHIFILLRYSSTVVN